VLAAIFVVEWLLAAPTAEWFAVSLLGSPGSATVLSWLLPTAIFLLELLVAVQTYEEAERRRDGEGTWRPVILGLFLVVVMPLFSLARSERKPGRCPLNASAVEADPAGGTFIALLIAGGLP
jgi:hypothetical protein